MPYHANGSLRLTFTPEIVSRRTGRRVRASARPHVPYPHLHRPSTSAGHAPARFGKKGWTNHEDDLVRSRAGLLARLRRRKAERQGLHQHRHIHRHLLRHRVRGGVPGLHSHLYGAHLRHHPTRSGHPLHAVPHPREEVRHDHHHGAARGHHHVRHGHGLLQHRHRIGMRPDRRPHRARWGLRQREDERVVARRVQLLDDRQLPAHAAHGRQLLRHHARGYSATPTSTSSWATCSRGRTRPC